MKVMIGIAYHKACKFIKSKGYIPIQVGAARSHIDLGIQRDDEGDNISLQNAYCSEMSATYWIWKNLRADYKGLFHYRRFLTFQRRSSLYKIPSLLLYWSSKLLSPIIKDSRYNFSTYSNISILEDESDNVLEKFKSQLIEDIEKTNTDLYCAGYSKMSTYSMRTHLERAIGTWHSKYAIELIEKEYPEFSLYFNKTLKDNKFVGFNMIIAKSELFDEYCELMFGILSKYQAHMNEGINDTSLNVSMLRDSGYLAELITDAYIRSIKAKGRKVRHLGVCCIDIELGGMSSKKERLITKLSKRV